MKKVVDGLSTDDVWTRLEKLQLGVEEPELSPEQLRINDQAQEDELLVLESIFGDNVFVLDRQNGLRCFQIHVHIEVPDELTVSWLNSANISSLCSMLDSIWKDLLGQEIIYQWVEWLHGSSLSHLRFDREIKLGFCAYSYIGDRRAISWAVSPEVDMPSLKSYDEEQHHENFCRNIL
ncbi:hypothetical protein CQW23_33183 [Capsicum baccatum]|uniref:RWD domain-containing protein n=1 Tax=Capsicum baccatum TaxID=33114 RepID=A0A2G2V2K7_CAPBA|nr:hypothetical protein CQW23_33183 [Capsicum baccatum]